MTKIKIDVLLKQNGVDEINKTYNGIFLDNIIKYSDGMMNVYDVDNDILKRRISEYELILDFKNSTALYIYQNMKLLLNLDVYCLCRDMDKINVKYRLENDTFEYILSWRKL